MTRRADSKRTGDSPRALEIAPLGPDRWQDLERLFGTQGAYGGCWCMWWRTTRRAFAANGSQGNRRDFRAIVRSGTPTGVLAYRDGEPVGWCSIAPRETYPALERSRTLKRLDDEPVWSIVCFFVARGHRGEGVAEELLEGAAEYARSRGARILEAYPTDPRGRRLAPVSSYMGVPKLFERAGFSECRRPSAARVIMRRRLEP